MMSYLKSSSLIDHPKLFNILQNEHDIAAYLALRKGDFVQAAISKALLLDNKKCTFRERQTLINLASGYFKCIPENLDPEKYSNDLQMSYSNFLFTNILF